MDYPKHIIAHVVTQAIEAYRQGDSLDDINEYLALVALVMDLAGCIRELKQ